MKYNVTGMSCAACQARVEKAVSKVAGVESVAVNLLTNSMTVEGSADRESVIGAVVAAGYGASAVEEADAYSANAREAFEDKETPKLVKRLIFSGILLLVLMYVSMGHHMWGWPVPAFMEGNMLAGGIVQAVLAAGAMFINRRFFINGIRGVFHGGPNMDTLVALGSGISFIYSLVCLIGSVVKNGPFAHVDLYFESAAMIVTLITVGKLLESISKGRTSDAIRSLMELAPENAKLIIDRASEEWKEVPAGDIKVGDVFIVEAGDRIPVDGIVISGNARIDESALTGESEPIDKETGSEVSTATDVFAGKVICRATGIGQDTTLSRIIKMVSDAQMAKAPIARIADKVAGVFVPVVIGIAAVTALIWAFAGKDAAFVLNRAISVLVISCPCALGLATPVAIMVGSGLGSRHGILFKTATSLEKAGKGEIIVLDKTGTITTGEVGSDTVKPDSARGIDELKNLGLQIVMLSGDKPERAQKIASEVGIKNVVAGVLPGGKGDIVKALQSKGSVLMVGDGINDAPALKTADTGMAIGAGKDIAIDAADVVLMNSRITDVAAAIRLSRRTVLNIKENLFWAFIYNIICIPLAAGLYTALFDWAPMNPMIGAACMACSSFCVVMNALRLNLFDPYKEGRKCCGRISEEDIQKLTDELNLKIEKTPQIQGGFTYMEKTIKIEGMMCPHCSGRVKEALEKLDGVAEAIVSHETGTAVVKFAVPTDEELQKTVEDAGYKFLGIE